MMYRVIGSGEVYVRKREGWIYIGSIDCRQGRQCETCSHAVTNSGCISYSIGWGSVNCNWAMEESELSLESHSSIIQ